ncbi:MAG TPA: hypothetical protein VK864_17070, partial [Longimicrobiales bacterium]|nr:hypothetical protein [Longimicrobiales bacterium]
YDFFSGDLIPNGAAWAAPVIDVLGRLLSDHTEFSHRLSASSFRERYEPIRNTFVIRHAPLLALKGPRWTFQYDRDGNPRADGLEAAYWGDITGRWERNLDYINAITSALDRLRTVSPQTSEAPLDPGYLSATLQILRTTPSWRDVEPAVKRLTEFRKSRRFYSKFDEDANTIASYVAEVLLPGRQNLLNALFAGTIVGRAATPNLHDAAVKGLAVMSACYWSRHDAEETADVTLERICSGLEHRWPALHSIRAQLRARLIMLEDADEPAQFDVWSEAVTELSTGIDQAVRIGAHERTHLVAAAWKEWQSYFAQQYPKTRFVPGIDGLICQAAQVGPSLLLTNEPTTMALVQWSEVYYRAIAMESADDAEYAPKWLGVFARAALGLLPRMDVATTLSTETPGVYTANELRTIVENLSAEQVPPALKRILIVRQSSGSAVTSWSGPAGYGTIALTAQQIERLGQLRRSARRPVSGIDDCDHIFVEQGGPEAELAMDNLARWFVGAVPPVTLFGDATQTPTWAARVIPTPRTASDLVRTADAVALAGPDALPAPLSDLWNPGTGMIGQIETRGIDQLIMFNLRAAPKTPNEMVIRSRQGVQTAVLSFTGESLQRTDRFVRRHYRVTYDGVRVRLEQSAATFAPLDSLLPRRLHSALFSPFVPNQSVELTPGPAPTEWSIALRVVPPAALKLVGGSGQERRESALLIVRSTRT